MKVVYSELHRRHAPANEFSRDGLIPYPDTPDRADAILGALKDRGLGQMVPPRDFAPTVLLAVHDPDYLHFLEHVGPAWTASGDAGDSLAANTFAARRPGRRPPGLVDQLGYYAYDTTPLVQGTWEAAWAAARCALTGAELLLEGEPFAYALCRPPGHHAGRDFCGGYCYLNNAAAAAAHLNQRGRGAILDLDYHHGNGTQDIFYASDQVLFVSLHGDPAHAYPLFWGYPEERGTGPGLGFTHNLVLPAGTDDERYAGALEQAMELVRGFAPDWLVVSAGFDTYEKDPIGDFAVSLPGFRGIGTRLAGLRLPTLLVQEGGYHGPDLGAAAASLLAGLTGT